MPKKDKPAGPTGASNLTRRTFLKKSSIAALMGASGVFEIPPARTRYAVGADLRRHDEPPVSCGLIGYGAWGREIAATLMRLPEARLVAVCDPYDVMLKRAERAVPQAARHLDYRQVLDDPAVQAVFVATPTHQHRDIAVAALQAGKHVYCEAPLAATVEDARAIAQAARAANKQIFQVGLLTRTEPTYRSIFGFIRSGAIGRPVMTRAQWHAKESWRRTSPSREREREMNWRLDPDVTAGLVGEQGVQQLDTAIWIHQALPLAVTGFGQIMLWNDGRTVPDTVQAVFEFPGGLRLLYDATLASSFDAAYDLYYGSDSTIMLRDSKGWMFKEVDAPVLGWEVYARKDSFYKEKGIALIANATKLEALGQDPTADDPNAETPLYHALKAFMDNFFYGPFPAVSGYQEGYQAAVAALKANEAITQGKKITFEPAWFELG